MKQEIVARVHFDPTGLQIVVRKAIFKDDGKIDKKYGLSKDDDWIEVPEKTMYPDECYLPIALWDSYDTGIVKDAVEALQNREELRVLCKELNDREGVDMNELMKQAGVQKLSDSDKWVGE